MASALTSTLLESSAANRVTQIPPSLTSEPRLTSVSVELAKPMLSVRSGRAMTSVNIVSQSSLVICIWGRPSPSTELWASTIESLSPSFDAAFAASVTVVGFRSSERNGELEMIERSPFPKASVVMLVVPILSCTGPLILLLSVVSSEATNREISPAYAAASLLVGVFLSWPPVP